MRYKVQTYKDDEKRIPKGDPEWFTLYINALRHARDKESDMLVDGLDVVLVTPMRPLNRKADYIVEVSEHGDHDEEVPEELRNPFVPEED